MATPSQISRHDGVIERMLNDSEIASLTVTKTMENSVADLILASDDPRAEIRNTIRDIWQNFSGAVVGMFERAAGDTIKLHKEMGLDTQGAVIEDVGVITELKTTSLASLNSTATPIADTIVNAVTVAGITGASLAATAQNSRIAISGYLATVEDQNITMLQEAYRTLIRNGDFATARGIMPEIRAAWGNTPVGPNLLAMSKTASHDHIMDFDSVYSQWRGESLGVTVWRYAGGVSSNTRDFCASVSGEEFTREQARAMWASRSWGGKRSGDPFVVRGGYNCRHYWVPVNKNIVGNLRRLQQ